MKPLEIYEEPILMVIDTEGCWLPNCLKLYNMDTEMHVTFFFEKEYGEVTLRKNPSANQTNTHIIIKFLSLSLICSCIFFFNLLVLVIWGYLWFLEKDPSFDKNLFHVLSSKQYYDNKSLPNLRHYSPVLPTLHLLFFLLLIIVACLHVSINLLGL